MGSYIWISSQQYINIRRQSYPMEIITKISPCSLNNLKNTVEKGFEDFALVFNYSTTHFRKLPVHLPQLKNN